MLGVEKAGFQIGHISRKNDTEKSEAKLSGSDQVPRIVDLRQDFRAELAAYGPEILSER